MVTGDSARGAKLGADALVVSQRGRRA